MLHPSFVLQVIEFLPDHYRIFNTGNHDHSVALQVSMSILKTRLSRCAHVIAGRRSVGVGGSPVTMAFLPLPRFAGVTFARCRLFGANTPWKGVKFTHGFGTSAAR